MSPFASGVYYLLPVPLHLKSPQIFLFGAVLSLAGAVYCVRLMPDSLLRFLLWCATHSLYRIRILGRDNIPEKGGALFVCNHVSFVDAVLLLASTDRQVRFMMFQGQYELPHLKPFAKILGMIPISSEQRFGTNSPAIVVPALLDALKKETNLVATLSLIGALGKFGTNGRTAIPVLKSVLESQPGPPRLPSPRWAAMWALERIDPETAKPFVEKWKASLTNASPIGASSLGHVPSFQTNSSRPGFGTKTIKRSTLGIFLGAFLGAALTAGIIYALPENYGLNTIHAEPLVSLLQLVFGHLADNPASCLDVMGAIIGAVAGIFLARVLPNPKFWPACVPAGGHGHWRHGHLSPQKKRRGMDVCRLGRECGFRAGFGVSQCLAGDGSGGYQSNIYRKISGHRKVCACRLSSRDRIMSATLERQGTCGLSFHELGNLPHRPKVFGDANKQFARRR